MPILVEITEVTDGGILRTVTEAKARTYFGVQKAWWKSAKDIQAEFNRQVLDKSSKSGRVYIIKDRLGRGRKHKSSAPGQTPANRTGKYRRGFDFTVADIQLTVGNTEQHAEYLESGTSRMAARPGLSNSIRSSSGQILNNIVNEIQWQLRP